MDLFGSQTRVETLNLQKKIGGPVVFVFGAATTKSPQTLKIQPPHSHPSGKKTAAKGNGVPGRIPCSPVRVPTGSWKNLPLLAGVPGMLSPGN